MTKLSLNVENIRLECGRCVDVDKRLKVEEGARERGSTDDDTINKSGEDN